MFDQSLLDLDGGNGPPLWPGNSSLSLEVAPGASVGHFGHIPSSQAALNLVSATISNSTLLGNGSSWWTSLFDGSSDEISGKEFAFRLFGAFFCILLVTSTIFGNTLVIIVVARFYRMRTVTNILLASLATADITVALLVMPFLVVYDFMRVWPFGAVACHLWISCDVMCCTASILHLCAVAVDRFWAITRPLRYRTSVNKRRLFCCIAFIWLCSAAISFIPIFTGLYHDGSVAPSSIFSMQDMPDCTLKVNRVYAVVSSMTSFYLPLPVMFYVYFRILLIAERQAREIKQLQISLQQNGALSGAAASGHMAIGAMLGRSDSNVSSLGEGTGPGGVSCGQKLSVPGITAGHGPCTSDAKRHVERSLRRRSKQLLTDTKAIRTLGMIMGVFCLFWLPFFIMYLVSAFCDSCELSYEWRSALTWLGYVNSSINPIIYTFMNKDFKTAFRRVLCCSTMIVIDGEHTMDELSTTSRSAQRIDRGMHIAFDLPTPAISRTPSATPETTQWPAVGPEGKLIIPPATGGRKDRDQQSRASSFSVTS